MIVLKDLFYNGFCLWAATDNGYVEVVPVGDTFEDNEGTLYPEDSIIPTPRKEGRTWVDSMVQVHGEECVVLFRFEWAEELLTQVATLRRTLKGDCFATEDEFQNICDDPWAYYSVIDVGPILNSIWDCAEYEDIGPEGISFYVADLALFSRCTTVPFEVTR